MLIRRGLALVAALSLAACGGGGGSSSVPTVYSPVGIFSGAVTGVSGTPGAIAIQVNSDGSGEFAASFTGNPPIDISFTSQYGKISGSEFSISPAYFTANGFATNCTFAFDGKMVNINEMDGSYSATCGSASGTIPFKIIRTQLQSKLKFGSASPLHN